MDAEQEGNGSWPCVDALFAMFFSDRDSYSSDGILRKDVRSLIACKLSGSTSEITKLCRQDNVLISDRVNALLEIEPRLKFQHGMSRISWYRFGFRAQLNQVALSNRFIKSFGQWRLRLSLTRNSYTVCDLGAETKRPIQMVSMKNVEYSGYTMDMFFHCADEIDLFSNKVHWQLARVNPEQENSDVSRSSSNSRKRSIEEIVGARNCLAIKECISIAARDDKFPEIEAKKVAGRYQSTVTRDELTELLSSRFKERLTCAESVIKRALSEFVHCRRAR